ncbi:AI-2E family transporter [Candidatus Halobonum tyrrellensis]|uniref:Permease n=1 Tax=Candidatus Halobonum tyrrellensis G22 TaxID=1324957 RepID=V4GSM1_9EURY|nr:AI-2E family transporter [Candidatus Halobonum tyrrellensis]ESP88091.1 hypothetical protein K933_10387 [Candidatus Halobonum tyrrellensis G22]
MSRTGRLPTPSRARWWLLGVAGAAVVGLFLYSFVGTFVSGLFVYYAIRPLRDRLDRVFGSDGLDATATVLVLVVPILAIAGYAGYVAFQELTAFAGPDVVRFVTARLPGDPSSVSAVVENPIRFSRRLAEIDQVRDGIGPLLGTLGAIANVLLHLSLVMGLVFFLLRDGDEVDRWVRERVFDPDSTGYAFLRTVDADLEGVYFGNFVTVVLVGVAAVGVYNGYNALVPAAVALPAPTLLALLTGLATFVPIVVGKLVYVPAGLFLAATAVRTDSSLVYPVAFVVVAFLLLDILPQTVLRPYLSGRDIHTGLVLFAYVLGAALFGWYGLFLGPLLAVFAVHAVGYSVASLRAEEGAVDDESVKATGLGAEPEEVVDDVDGDDGDAADGDTAG